MPVLRINMATPILESGIKGSDKPFSTCGNGLKPKDLCGIPWRLAFALQADGWYLRSGYHLVKAKSHAGERDRPADKGA